MTLCPGFVACALFKSYMGRNPAWVARLGLEVQRPVFGGGVAQSRIHRNCAPALGLPSSWNESCCERMVGFGAIWCVRRFPTVISR
eukprot:14777548-Alexandrium_andersonii.AAC.1